MSLGSGFILSITLASFVLALILKLDSMGFGVLFTLLILVWVDLPHPFPSRLWLALNRSLYHHHHDYYLYLYLYFFFFFWFLRICGFPHKFTGGKLARDYIH